jgi:hypothetical protein
MEFAVARKSARRVSREPKSWAREAARVSGMEMAWRV